MEPAHHFTFTSRQPSYMPSVQHNPLPTGSPTLGQSSGSNSWNINGVAFRANTCFGSNTSSPSNGAGNNSHCEGRAINSRALLTSALEEAQTAVQLDHLGKTTAALDCYRRATAYLATAMQVSSSREELHRLQTIVDSYQLRIHVLAAKSMKPPAMFKPSRPEPFSANYSSSAPLANVSPLQGASDAEGALNLAAVPSRSHVTFQHPGMGGSQPASTSVAPLRTKRSVSSNGVPVGRHDDYGEVSPRDATEKRGQPPRLRSHTLGSLSRTPGDPATSIEPLLIPRRRTERNGLDYSSDSGSNSSAAKKRSRDLLLAKSTPIHLAPSVPLPPLPSDDASSQPPATPLHSSAMLRSPPLSPKKASRRISPLVSLETTNGRDGSLTPVFHSNLPSPVSPRLEMDNREDVQMLEPIVDHPLQETRADEAMDSREIFSLTPVFHNTQKVASPKPSAPLSLVTIPGAGASTSTSAKEARGLYLPAPAFHGGYSTSTSLPKSLSSQSKDHYNSYGLEGMVNRATASTPDTWLPNFTNHVNQRSNSSPSLQRRVQIKDRLGEFEQDQDSITKELFATVEVDRADETTPLAPKIEPNSTISVHFSTTFVNRKHQEPCQSSAPVEPVKSFVLGETNSFTYNSNPLPQSKPMGAPFARAALFDRPLPPDPTPVFSFPPGIASPSSDLPKDRRQIRRSWTLIDVIKDDPFQDVNESYQRKVSSQEPAPTEPFLRCFWLMRRLEQTMTQGGFLTKRLYIPPQVWYQQTPVRLPAVETKLQGCQQLARMLDDLMIQSNKGIVTLLIPGGASVDQDQDRLMLLKELEALEFTAMQIWTKLSKKLSFIQKPDKHPGSMGLNASSIGGSVSTSRSDSASASSGGGGSAHVDQTRARSPISSLASGGTIAGAMFHPIQFPKPLFQPAYDSMDEEDEGMETLGQKVSDQNRKGDPQANPKEMGTEPIERTLSLDSATPSSSTSNSTALDLVESVTSLESPSPSTHSLKEKPSPPLPSTPVPKTSTWKRHLVRKSLDDFIRSRDKLPYDHSMFVPIVNPKKAMASGGSSPSQNTKQDQGLGPNQTSSFSYNSGSSGLPGADLLTSQFRNFSMSIQKSILYDKLEDTSVYTETIIHLFQSSYVLESMLKHYDSLVPFQIHLQLINKLRRLCDFLYFVVCPFVLQDLQELIPKYLKQVGLSVPE